MKVLHPSKTTSLLAVLLAVLSGGCGKDGANKDNSGSGYSPSEVRGTHGDLSSVVGLEYRLRVWGCDTGTHSFRDSESFCRALLDDELNHHCARERREDIYVSRCGELPSTTSGATTTPLSIPPQTGLSVFTSDSAVFTIDSPTIVLPPSDEARHELVESVSRAMVECGVSRALGIRCLDRQFLLYVPAHEEISDGTSNTSVFAVISASEFTPFAVAITETASDSGALSPSLIQLYAIPNSLRSRLDAAVLRGAYVNNTLRLIAQYRALPYKARTLAVDLSRRLPDTGSLRQFIHWATFAVSQGTAIPMVDVVTRIRGQQAVSMRDEAYQHAFIDLVTTDRLNLSGPTVISAILPLAESEFGSVSQRVALAVRERGHNSDRIRELLRDAMASDIAETRRQALQLIGASPSSIEEANAVLARLGDQSATVRATALSIASEMALSDENLDTLSLVLSSAPQQVQREVIALVAKVTGTRATNLLVQYVGSDAHEVRAPAVQALQRRPLGQADLRQVVGLLTSARREIRRDAATALLNSRSPIAIDGLIATLDHEWQPLVDTAARSLLGKPMNQAQMNRLVALLQIRKYHVRRAIADILGTIRTPASRRALEQRLRVETDTLVRTHLEAALANF